MTSAPPKVTPLALKRCATAFDNPDWLFDLKYDGVRARLVSRNRNRFSHLDTLAAVLAKRLRVKDAILDGEISDVKSVILPSQAGMLATKGVFDDVAYLDLLWQETASA